jgi:hypothetical protein
MSLGGLRFMRSSPLGSGFAFKDFPEFGVAKLYTRALRSVQKSTIMHVGLGAEISKP